jgi:hypothetical protein
MAIPTRDDPQGGMPGNVPYSFGGNPHGSPGLPDARSLHFIISGLEKGVKTKQT